MHYGLEESMRTATQVDFFAPTTGQDRLSWSQRLILRRFHPLSIICGLIGVIWAVYFLWERNWAAAAGAVIGARLAGTSLVWRARLDLLSQTVMGRLALLHLHPVNLGLQAMGGAWSIYGLWTHATVPILGGLSLILAGHAIGWEKVHKSLAIRDERK